MEDPPHNLKRPKEYKQGTVRTGLPFPERCCWERLTKLSQKAPMTFGSNTITTTKLFQSGSWGHKTSIAKFLKGIIIKSQWVHWQEYHLTVHLDQKEASRVPHRHAELGFRDRARLQVYLTLPSYLHISLFSTLIWFKLAFWAMRAVCVCVWWWFSRDRKDPKLFSHFYNKIYICKSLEDYIQSG